MKILRAIATYIRNLNANAQPSGGHYGNLVLTKGLK